MSDVDDVKEGEFIVERILQMREFNNHRWYLIKWEGYPQSESTWEPEENCKCPELICEFWERVGRSSLVPHSDIKFAGESNGSPSNSPGELSDLEHSSFDVEVPDAGENAGEQVDEEEEEEEAKETSDQCEKSEDESSGEEMEEEEKEEEEAEEGEKGPSPDRKCAPLTRGRSVSIHEPISVNVSEKSESTTATKIDEENLEDLNIVETNMEADQVVGVTVKSEQLIYLLRCHVTGKMYSLPSKVAKEKCPQAVIKFLEQKITFKVPEKYSRIVF